jgi:FG-GAP-like repeat
MFPFARTLSISFLVVIASALASAQVIFTTTAIPSGDVASHSIVSADFNNDGILDLVTINDHTLSFYKGLGGGKYARPVNQPLSPNLGQVVAADFSRHGTPDLAIASPSGITILIGNNNGTFKQGTNIALGGAATSLALADFNGDHLPDIAVSFCPSAGGSCRTRVYLGLGNGHFALASSLADGGGPIVAGDLNADGHQDIAVVPENVQAGVAGNLVALYLGLGNGHFKSPVLANLSNISSLAIGDVYNNRIQSLVALVGSFIGGGNFQTQIFTLRFSGGILRVENQNVVQPVTGIPFQFVTVGDLNGDFKDDIFLTGGNVHGHLSAYLLGRGNGTFQSPVDVPTGEDSPVFPFIRDLDGDSRHDIAMDWTQIFVPTSGGADVLHNTNAATNCSLPRAGRLAVHICAPAVNGQVVGQTFTFKGSGNALNGIAKRMELWIDGRKVAQNLEDQLRATVTLTRGNHVAAFVVVDSFDRHVSGSVSFTSKF